MYSEVLQQMDLLLDNFQNTRAFFPYMTDKLIGTKSWVTASFYEARGIRINFFFSKPLQREDIDRINSIGHWINECFVLRLYAILNHYGIVSDKKSINKNLDGHDEVDILRRLRQVIAHTSGRYNSKSSDDRKLYERIVNHFSVDAEPAKVASQFPLPIDSVLFPLAEGCKRYIKGLAEHCANECNRAQEGAYRVHEGAKKPHPAEGNI